MFFWSLFGLLMFVRLCVCVCFESRDLLDGWKDGWKRSTGRLEGGGKMCGWLGGWMFG